MENLVIFIFGCIAGCIFYNAAVTLGIAWRNLLMFRLVELQCLQLLAMSLEDAVFMKETRVKSMKKTDAYELNQIKITRNEDKYFLADWKARSIQRLIGRYPENYKRVVSYDDWSGAMEWLNLHTEKVLDG
tara:strand:- start:258 stop:650 length:393 start_codon:yes stop_codon:yes gene_type:complete